MIEYADIEGMLNPAEAIKATVEAIRLQGRGAVVQVSIDSNTEWAGADNRKVVKTGDHAEPPEAGREPAPAATRRY